jgi:hypothetical protein
MFLVASEDCIISPSFPNEVHFKDSEGTEQVLLTKEVEAPGSVKVRAKVGSSFVNNTTSIRTDLRQVPNASFLTQPEPAIINTGEGIISLFNCSSRPIKINKGDMIADCADINNNFNLPALHDSMRLLSMHSLFFAQAEFEVSQSVHSLGSRSSKHAPKTVTKAVVDLQGSSTTINLAKAVSRFSNKTSYKLPSENMLNLSASGESERANEHILSHLPAKISCSSCTSAYAQAKFSRSQLRKFGTRARCADCVHISESSHSPMLSTSETHDTVHFPLTVSQTADLHSLHEYISD